MPVLIEATARYGADLSGLLPAGVFESDVDVDGPPGTSVRYEGMIEFRGADIPPILQFMLDAGSGATGMLIATWIISNFRGRADRVTINRREIDLDDGGEVRRIVEEEVTIDRP